MADGESKLIHMDPESEQCFEALKATIREELSARVAGGDDPSTPQGAETLSELIADVILDVFVVRRRQSPRYRWDDKRT
jgi:hypothetical protein